MSILRNNFELRNSCPCDRGRRGTDKHNNKHNLAPSICWSMYASISITLSLFGPQRASPRVVRIYSLFCSKWRSLYEFAVSLSPHQFIGATRPIRWTVYRCPLVITREAATVPGIWRGLSLPSTVPCPHDRTWFPLLGDQPFLSSPWLSPALSEAHKNSYLVVLHRKIPLPTDPSTKNYCLT